MAERQNTGNAIPSNALKDFNDNTIIVDEWTNSKQDNTQDRFGNNIPTRAKLTNELTQVIEDATAAKNEVEKVVEDLPNILEGLRGPEGPQGEKGERGEAVITELEPGLFAFSINESGDLVLTYNNDEVPPFRIEDGNLVYELGE